MRASKSERTDSEASQSVAIRVWLAPIRLYQRYISPLKPMPSCRFRPTCSQYAIEAVQTRGIVVGSVKAAWRILRCNPLSPGGYDPVMPERREED